MKSKTRQKITGWLELSADNTMWKVYDESDPPAKQLATYLDNFHWDIVCHLTFKHDISEPRARKKFKAWIDALNKHMLGRRWHNRSKRSRTVYWVCSFEVQKRGVIHIHCVVGRYTGTARTARQLWNTFTQRGQIEQYDSENTGMEYAMKAVNDECCEIDFSDNFHTLSSSGQLHHST